LLVFGFELLQLTGAIAGTFCISDMIWSAIGITTGLTTVQIVMRRKLLIIRESHSNKDNAQLYLEST
jgi:hypothetical protein